MLELRDFDVAACVNPVILIHALYTCSVATAVLKRLPSPDRVVLCSRTDAQSIRDFCADEDIPLQVADETVSEEVLAMLIRDQRKAEGKQPLEHVVMIFNECVFDGSCVAGINFRHYLWTARKYNVTILLGVTGFGGIPGCPKTFITHALIDPGCYTSADDIRYLQRNIFTFATAGQLDVLRDILDSIAFGEYLVGMLPENASP